MIHLDTSFLIRALVQGSPEDRTLRVWLRTGEPLAMSTLAWTEFLCGPLEARQLDSAKAIVPGRVAFSEDHAALSSRLFNDTGRRRGSLIDCMLASTAILADASFATANSSDFRRFLEAGLRIVDSTGDQM